MQKSSKTWKLYKCITLFFVFKFPTPARDRWHCTTSAALKKREFTFQATFSPGSPLWYLGPRPHASVFVWKRIFFSPVWPTKTAFFKNRSPEYRFLKTLASRLRVDGYDDVIHHLPKHYACSVRDAIVFPLFSVFAWTDENDWITLRVDSYFFWKWRKKSPFSKYRDTYGRGLKLPTCRRLAEKITSCHRTRRFRRP